MYGIEMLKSGSSLPCSRVGSPVLQLVKSSGVKPSDHWKPDRGEVITTGNLTKEKLIAKSSRKVRNVE